jgi:hypothetical protein
MKKTKSHGGIRKGAGKPSFFDSPMERKNVMLDKTTIQKLTKLGRGNLSEGIRKAATLIL